MTEINCDAETAPCDRLSSELLGLLGRKYVLEVVCVIEAHDTVRFGDIESHVPEASTSTLSSRLEELTDAGLVRRERYDEIPPRVEYELTDDGRELGERLAPVVEWIAQREA
jgi:DNA-binding HxlR family transcriptional regulator